MPTKMFAAVAKLAAPPMRITLLSNQANACTITGSTRQ